MFPGREGDWGSERNMQKTFPVAKLICESSLIVCILWSSLLQTVWFLLPKLKQFDLNELFDKCKSLNTCTYYVTEEENITSETNLIEFLKQEFHTNKLNSRPMRSD